MGDSPGETKVPNEDSDYAADQTPEDAAKQTSKDAAELPPEDEADDGGSSSKSRDVGEQAPAAGSGTDTRVAAPVTAVTDEATRADKETKAKTRKAAKLKARQRRDDSSTQTVHLVGFPLVIAAVAFQLFSQPTSPRVFCMARDSTAIDGFSDLKGCERFIPSENQPTYESWEYIRGFFQGEKRLVVLEELTSERFGSRNPFSAPEIKVWRS